MTDKSTIQALLQQLATEWPSLQAAVVEREREIQQLEKRRAQLAEEMLRNQGAMAYNHRLANQLTAKLAEIEAR